MLEISTLSQAFLLAHSAKTGEKIVYLAPMPKAE